MPTEHVRFGPAILRRALAEIDGRHPSHAPLVLRDPTERGLTIRVQGKRAAWYLKFNGTFKRLGAVGNPETKPDLRRSGVLYSGREAAELAGRVRQLLRLGQDPSDYLSSRALGLGHAGAIGTIGSISARSAGAWTWETLVDRFIADKIAQPTITYTGKTRPPSPKTAKEVSSILGHSDLTPLKKVLLRDLRKSQIEALRNKWNDDKRTGAQRKLVVYTKSALRWAKAHHDAAGLGDIPPWWLELRHVRHATRAQTRIDTGGAPVAALTPQQVAMLLFIAEKHRVAPGRRLALRTNEITMAALWWVALSTQRTHAAYAVRCARIDDRRADNGWYEVAWLPADIKSKRHFTLPVPTEMFRRTIGRALAAPNRRQNSVWVFASSRTKLRGRDEMADKPVSDSVLNSLMNRLRGNGDRRARSVDLLAKAGLRHFTLHQLRDSLATFLASAIDLPGAAASAILDHEPEGLEPTAREAAVTRDHYNKSQRLALKARGLAVWNEAILTEYERLVRDERVRRYGARFEDPAMRGQLLANLQPAEAWLFDCHLPPANATRSSRHDRAGLSGDDAHPVYTPKRPDGW